MGNQCCRDTLHVLDQNGSAPVVPLVAERRTDPQEDERLVLREFDVRVTFSEAEVHQRTAVPDMFAEEKEVVLAQKPPPDFEATSAQEQEEDVCVLYWTLTLQEQADCRCQRFIALHDELAMCIKLFGAQNLQVEPTSGLIRGRPIPEEDLSAADAAVRIGQLLCRWAEQEHPVVGLLVGVHIGTLCTLVMPGSGSVGARRGYFGEACYEAKVLAEDGGKERMVHMSQAVKNGLYLMRQLPLVVSASRESFFLDPATDVFTNSGCSSCLCDGSHSTSQMVHRKILFGLEFSPRNIQDPEAVPKTVEQFVDFLESYNIDTSKFGKGTAKSIAELYESVITHRTERLEVVDLHGEAPTLERVMTIARLSLRVTDSSGAARELRQRMSQHADDGPPGAGTQASMGFTQLCTVVLHEGETDRWLAGIERCFEQRFGLSQEVQRASFVVDMSTYEYREERSSTEALPGIVTTTQYHSVTIEVLKTGMNIAQLGLPRCEDFSLSSLGEVSYWTWAPYEKRREDELTELLMCHGVEVNQFSANAFAELYDELYSERQLSSLVTVDGDLVRTIRVVKVHVHATILGVEHRCTIKAKYQKGTATDSDAGRPLSMRISPEEDWLEGCKAALHLRLGFTPKMQQEHLYIDAMTHRVTEEIGYSRSYPGLKSTYEINEVRVWIINSGDTCLSCIGLPGGTDFTVARREGTTRVLGEGDLVVTQWSWSTASPCLLRKRPSTRMRTRRITIIDPQTLAHGARGSAVGSERRKVPAPEVVIVSPTSAERSRFAKSSAAVSVPGLVELMRGKRTEWARAQRAADRIMDEDYSCKDFHLDITQAFPELCLYCVSEDDTTAGRSADEEYQRTIGAMFALFWLMRQDLGGQESFCFGLDDDWKPRPKPVLQSDDEDADDDEAALEEQRKRVNFYNTTKWDALRALLVDAGLLRGAGGKHDPERVLAMLVLLAIHDIMKLRALQPQVVKSDFNGYKVGEVITDHDMALNYVLTRFPHLLPSFDGLKKAQKESIMFTHCKLEYNMGWLVQAEAPPGALLKTFRRMVTAGKVPGSDIAFYFVHWLADLAGAEPFPLEGCEKFTLKFPQAILERFIESFAFIQSLSATTTETCIVERYLEQRWPRCLGPLPAGPSSIARMRLICMAQGSDQGVLDAFDSLPHDDQVVLASELALTGCKGQSFERDPVDYLDSRKRGPAILVYYAPALMQRAGRKDPRAALLVLAEVFRKSRALWPLTQKEADITITVRIDALKEIEVPAILHPEQDKQFLIARTSGLEGAVLLKSVAAFQDLDWKTHQILCFRSTRPSVMSNGRSCRSMSRVSLSTHK